MRLKPYLPHRASKFAVIASTAIIFVGAHTPNVQAATWVNTGTTDWNTASNWNPIGVPSGAPAVINTNTGSIATISANPTFNPGDVIVGDGSGTNGLLLHTSGVLTVGSWLKIGHNGGTGIYNLGGAGTGGTYTGLSQGTGSITVSNFGSLRLGGDGATTTGSGTLNINTTGSVNVSNADIRVGSSGSGTLNMDNGTINKTGDGTFIVGQNFSGVMRVSNGTVNNSGEFWIGNGPGGNGTLTLSGTGTVNTNSWLSIGRSGGTGVLNVSGGTLTKTNPDSSNFVIGDGSTGTLNQTGGTIAAQSEVWIGQGAGSNGSVTISNGSLHVNSWLAVGRSSGTGTLTVSGTASVNQGITDSGSLLELTNFNAGGNGTVNLNGGTLTVNGVTQSGGSGGTSTFNFNGGTLRARRDNTAFMQGLTTARIRDGGANIDTNGFNVTIAQALSQSSEAGQTGTGILSKVGSGTLTLAGTGDNSGTRARVDAGVLVLAKTSSASVHAVGSPGGTDYALQITGSGTAELGGTNGDQIYKNSSVSMTGGTFDLAGLSEGFDGLAGSAGTITNSTAATTSTLTLGENNSASLPSFGGAIQNGSGTVALIKTGTGTQTLSGNNLYSGGTTLSGGTLAVAHDSALGTGSLTMTAGTTLANFDTVAHTLGNDIAFSNTAGMMATISATSDMTLTGGLSGGTSGIQITKQGAGTLTIPNKSQSVGSGTAPAVWTVTGGGTLSLSVGINLGTIPSNPTTQVILDNGTFRTNSAGGNFASQRGMQITVAGGTWLDSGGGVNFDGAIANSGAFTINTPVTNATTLLNGAVSGSGSVIKSGAGVLSVAGANTYTGATTINAGTLEVKNDGATSLGKLTSTTGGVTVNNGGTLLLNGSSSVTDRISDTAAMSLGSSLSGSARFNTSNLSESVGALTLAGNSIIDLGTGSTSILRFAASGANIWTSGATLSIYNWSGSTGGGGTEGLFFGNDSLGLGSNPIARLSQISFYSGEGTGLLGTAQILSTGELVPVPEPSTYFAAAAVLGLVGWRERRRIYGGIAHLRGKQMT